MRIYNSVAKIELRTLSIELCRRPTVESGSLRLPKKSELQLGVKDMSSAGLFKISQVFSCGEATVSRYGRHISSRPRKLELRVGELADDSDQREEVYIVGGVVRDFFWEDQ